MRIQPEEQAAIISAITSYDINSEIYLLGSRLDDAKRGGDIDILVKSDCINRLTLDKIENEIFRTIDEQDRFESLTAKYARLSDLIIKQAIKLIDILDLDEPPETIRDSINRAEKKGLIESGVRFVEIRKLRNRIAHEYAESEGDVVGIYN